MKRKKVSHKLKGKGKKVRGKSEENGKWMRIIQVISIIVVLAVLAGIIGLNKPSVNTPLVDKSKAVLIDGIALTDPNPEFTRSVKEILSKANITLDIYEGEEVTINLLRKIGGYGLIILRLHSAIDKELRFLYIFSAERFNETGYRETEPTAIREGVPFYGNESYFTLRGDLLGDLSGKGLNGSIIILMGCNGTNSQQIIENLFDRGVKAIIAWDGYVDLNYTDKITIELLKAVYEEHMNFDEAVKKVMDERGADPTWKSRLEYLANSSG